jgi:hypothetical protein
MAEEVTRSEVRLEMIDRALKAGMPLSSRDSREMEVIWEYPPRAAEPYYWSVLASVAEDAAEWLTEMV